MHKPTAQELQLAFHLTTFGRYEILLPNIHFLHNELDIFGFRKNSGFSDEIEVKLSRSDFLADFKKTTSVKGNKIEGKNYSYYEHVTKLKHDAIKEGLYPCNYFSYLMPKELADKCEIPSYCGLYVYTVNNSGQGFVHEVIKAPRLHKRKLSDDKKYEIAKKAVFKCWNMMKGAI